MVVPADRPAALLLPYMVDLVGVAGDGVCVLYTEDGRAVDPERSLAQSGLLDGSVLRLIAAPEAPVPPRVTDLLEVMDSVDRGVEREHTWLRWSQVAAGPLLVVAGVGLLAAAPLTAAWAVLTLSAATAVLVCLLATLWSRRAPSAWRRCSGHKMPAAVGVAALSVIGLGGALAFWCTEEAALAAACVMTLSVLGPGALPGAALRVGGLLKLDARISEDVVVPHREAARAAGKAHAVLLVGLLVCGTATVAAAIATGHWGGQDRWATAVSGAAVVVWVCRMGHFPRDGQRSVIVATTTLAVIGWAVAWGAQRPDALVDLGVACLLAGLLVCVVVSSRISVAARAVGRRWVRRAETACTLALVPLLVGQVGLYTTLVSGLA